MCRYTRACMFFARFITRADENHGIKMHEDARSYGKENESS
jgi:hypothetical protein